MHSLGVQHVLAMVVCRTDIETASPPRRRTLAFRRASYHGSRSPPRRHVKHFLGVKYVLAMAQCRRNRKEMADC